MCRVLVMERSILLSSKDLRFRSVGSKH
jgi:hypothetical protein